MALLDRLRGRSEPVVDRWIVVGLGNPEAEYGGTRHNIGADTVRRLADQLGGSFKPHKAKAQVADVRLPAATHERLPLSIAVPFGYMNNSGGPVQALMAFYKVPADRLIVVYDEIDLALGQLRLKRGGGTAGHNGLRDVQRRISSPDFYRVRIGVGRPPGRQDPASYVLQRFRPKEREEIDVTVAKACDAIVDLITHGLEHAQNRHH